MGVAAKAAPANKARSMAPKMVLRAKADGIEVIRIHSRGRGTRLAQIRFPLCLVLWEAGRVRFDFPTLRKEREGWGTRRWWRG